MNFKKLPPISKNPSLLLRIGLGGVFVYAGVSIITSPGRWINIVPDWIETLISNHSFLIIYGIVEIALGILILIGIFLPAVSLIAFLNLFSVMLFSGIGDITFRDFGLSMAALTLFILSIYEKGE